MKWYGIRRKSDKKTFGFTVTIARGGGFLSCDCIQFQLDCSAHVKNIWLINEKVAAEQLLNTKPFPGDSAMYCFPILPSCTPGRCESVHERQEKYEVFEIEV